MADAETLLLQVRSALIGTIKSAVSTHAALIALEGFFLKEHERLSAPELLQSGSLARLENIRTLVDEILKQIHESGAALKSALDALDEAPDRNA